MMPDRMSSSRFPSFRRLWWLTTAACAALAVGALIATASAAAAAPLRYVALGDSYSAASGVLPLDPRASLPCLRSSRNYAHVIAQRLGAQLTDVTCGAAETKDFFTPQYPGIAPQLDALGPGAQLVTMTIGGNDSSVFINAILQCGAAGVLSLGQGSPCRDQNGSSFEDTIRNVTYPALVAALQAVRAKAPHAKIGILGYPWIMPPTVGCFGRMPVAAGDVPYVRGIQTTLNDAVARAATAAGVTYVDMNRVSEGHDACRPTGVRWVEPVLLGTNPVVVHPNAVGEAEMAAQAIRVLDPLAGAPAAQPTATSAVRLRLTALRRRGGRYSIRVSATGAKLRRVALSIQRLTSAGRRVPVGRKTLKATVGPSGRRVQLPLGRPRARTRYRIVARGLVGSTAVQRSLTFRAG